MSQPTDAVTYRSTTDALCALTRALAEHVPREELATRLYAEAANHANAPFTALLLHRMAGQAAPDSRARGRG